MTKKTMGHGDLLKNLLSKKNMKVATLARLSGVPASTIYNLIQRNNRNTDPETLAKISSALGISISFWMNYTNEELLLRDIFDSFDDKDTAIISKDLIKFAKKEKGKTLDEISYGLKFLGYNYTASTLQSIIDNQSPIDSHICYLIEYLILNETILSKKEFDLLNRYRLLSTGSKKAVENIIEKFVQSDKYETEKLEEWADNLRQTKKEHTSSTT